MIWICSREFNSDFGFGNENEKNVAAVLPNVDSSKLRPFSNRSGPNIYLIQQNNYILEATIYSYGHVDTGFDVITIMISMNECSILIR